MSATTKRGLPRKRVAAGASLEERILLHTDRSGEHWIWTGFVDKESGYGRMTIGKSAHYSHRISYRAFVGEIPDGLEVDHLCRVRACCNPFHLEAVTPQVNVRRGESVGARYNRMDYVEIMRRKREGIKVVDLGAYFAAERRQDVAA